MRRSLFALLASFLSAATAAAQPKDVAVVGLIPKSAAAIQIDGKLDDWKGAFVTPVHVGHPDAKNRSCQFFYLWDAENLYIGMRCLDQKPAHVGKDDQIWNGDSVEFYLDVRRGDQLGQPRFGPGTLHMFWTPFTGTEIKPRWQLRPLPELKGLKLEGVEVAGHRDGDMWNCEFKLPWKNFPEFKPADGDTIGIDCELCSSDGGPRVDRTFVYSSPASVGSPASFGRVRLVDSLDAKDLAQLGRALLPAAVSVSGNYPWIYARVQPSASLEATSIEAKLIDSEGKARKTAKGTAAPFAPAFPEYRIMLEAFDLPAGTYTLEIAAKDKAGRTVTTRSLGVVLR
ncbi:MAG: sugar-binding protein [Gemmataceae bacterium]